MSPEAENLPVDAHSHINHSTKISGQLLAFTWVHQNYSRVVVAVVLLGKRQSSFRAISEVFRDI